MLKRDVLMIDVEERCTNETDPMNTSFDTARGSDKIIIFNCETSNLKVIPNINDKLD